MHMDESSNPIPPNELGPPSASERTVTDALPAELAGSRERAVLAEQRHSGPIRRCQNEPQFGASVAVYCGSEEAVYLGFRVALSVMAAAAFEDVAEPGATQP
jgi:hypothetical protein